MQNTLKQELLEKNRLLKPSTYIKYKRPSKRAVDKTVDKAEEKRREKIKKHREILLSGFSASPFSDLRKCLGFTQTEWGNLLGISPQFVSKYETLSVLPSVAMAKRMQEEARKVGLAVTLDELYQNVEPKGMYATTEEADDVEEDVGCEIDEVDEDDE